MQKRNYAAQGDYRDKKINDSFPKEACGVSFV
jgi:hypothetical protein